jgi:hypothetical protein
VAQTASDYGVWIPDTAMEELKAIEARSEEEADAVLNALESELRAEPGEGTSSFDFEGKQYLVRQLSTGQRAVYRLLTQEEAELRTESKSPSFLLIGFDEGKEDELNEKLAKSEDQPSN